MNDDASAQGRASRRHLRFGWWALAVFAGLGMTLELLHGFKANVYLDVSNEPRRLMWTLAHAHGAAIAIINIAYGLTLESVTATSHDAASRALIDTLKAEVPIWKHQVFDDRTEEWVGTP